MQIVEYPIFCEISLNWYRKTLFQPFRNAKNKNISVDFYACSFIIWEKFVYSSIIINRCIKKSTQSSLKRKFVVAAAASTHTINSWVFFQNWSGSIETIFTLGDWHFSGGGSSWIRAPSLWMIFHYGSLLRWNLI